jgi:hypothetical protein
LAAEPLLQQVPLQARLRVLEQIRSGASFKIPAGGRVWTGIIGIISTTNVRVGVGRTGVQFDIVVADPEYMAAQNQDLLLNGRYDCSADNAASLTISHQGVPHSTLLQDQDKNLTWLLNRVAPMALESALRKREFVRSQRSHYAASYTNTSTTTASTTALRGIGTGCGTMFTCTGSTAVYVH